MRWLLLLFLCASRFEAPCEPLVHLLELPPGCTDFQPADWCSAGGQTIIAGSAADSSGHWRPLLLFVANGSEYRGGQEIAGSGSELLVGAAADEDRLFLLSNLRPARAGGGEAIQSMKVASVSLEGAPVWSATLGGESFANAGDLSWDARSATVAALGWLDSGRGDPGSGGWNILVALFEADGRQRWLATIGSSQDEIGGQLLATPGVVHVFYNSWKPKRGWDLVLARIEAETGAVRPRHRLPGRGSDAVADFQLMPNGNYRLLATTDSEGGPWGASRGKTDIALLEVNARGRILRCSRYGWEGSEYAHRLLDLGEGYLGIVGVTNSHEEPAGRRVGGLDLLLLIVDADGKLQAMRRAGTAEDDWPVAGEAGPGRIDILAVTKPPAGAGVPYVVRFER